ncbi:MAG: hypothetical protein KDB03_07510 [Planctomycetales bacterium]|nr:hypothetical protein [Planctomycetales bacterium]
MTSRFINGGLILLTIIGGLMATKAGARNQQLLTTYRKLEAKVGSLPIRDKTKVYFLALPTEEPLHYAWRVYLPGNFQYRWEYNSGSHSGSNSNSREFIAQVRFRESGGQGQVFFQALGGSSSLSLNDQNLANYLKERPDQLVVQQLADKNIHVANDDEVNVVLRLALPEEPEKTIFELKFGSTEAFEKQAR